MILKTYRNLVVWQKAKALVLQIYHISKLFPKDEQYGLIAQMKRASISVASNLAEGNQRRFKKERLRFFNIAQGSLIELDCQLEISLDLGFLEEKKYKETLELLNKTGYFLTRFIQAEIEKNNPPNPSNRTNLTNLNS